MSHALGLAELGRGGVEPNPLVGAVLVHDGVLAGEGWHQRFGHAHAEVNAIAAAGARARGATLYVTLEPCCHHGKTPPCTDAVLAAGIARVVVAMLDPFPQVAGQGAKRLTTAGIAVEVGLAQSQARRLNAPYLKLLTAGRPYTDQGGKIWLTFQQEGEEAVLRARDTGVGIAPEILPRIFDLFTQAERSLDRSQGGLGIGLALVQRLVELHGGTVTASSALGQGSEFVVRLPVVPPPEPRPSMPPTEKAKLTGASLRVLVVDDNVDTVTTLALLVKESGHDVRTAYDGSAVLEAALDYRPNLVLLDIGLPGLNGFEVAKQLRQQPTLKNIVLVAMTGYGQESDRRRSQEAGFDHHLVKPGDFGKVLQILATVSELPTR
jgi:pyrimidine deaminase RibD-like protein/CheY-like chemotaxis protein